MSATTLCPTCNTRFKVTQAQLAAHGGMVRCGRCQAVFNATDYLQDEAAAAETESGTPAAPQPSLPQDTVADRPTEEKPHDAEPQQTVLEATADPAEASVLAQQTASTADHPRFVIPVKKPEPLGWLWLTGNLLLLLVLLGQAAYFFRVELAATMPAIKPGLVAYCRLLRCSVPLPQKAELMSIESSDLEADPAQSSVIALNALLRNRATYAQAYPSLQLTLTDQQDKALARRTFQPAEYLKAGEDEKQGLAANRELGVKLNLDTNDLKPSGYRLFLYYPQ